MCLAETLEGLARAAARAERESDATVVPHACIWILSDGWQLLAKARRRERAGGVCGREYRLRSGCEWARTKRAGLFRGVRHWRSRRDGRLGRVRLWRSEYDSAKRRLKIRSPGCPASLQPTYFLVYVTHERNRRFWSDTRSPKVHRIKFEASLAKREALRGGECTEEAEGSRRGRTVFPRRRDVRAVRFGPSRPRATAARD